MLATNLVVVDRQLSGMAREVIGSLPLGSVLPRMISAMAWPPFMPGFGAHMNALTPSAVDSSTITPFVPITHAGITCGLELISTTTSGLPVSRATSASASSMAFCPPSSSSVAVEQVSPTSCTTSPTTATTRSERRAFSTASSSSCWSNLAETASFGRGWPSG